MLTNNFVYKVLAAQIPAFWDAIKYACVKADEIAVVDMPNYFNTLLQDLLGDKAQCFIILDDQRILHGITITRIIIDKVVVKKYLDIQVLYSMREITSDETTKYFKILHELAVKEHCFGITFNTRNQKIMQMAEWVGCTEQYRKFIYRLGGK